MLVSYQYLIIVLDYNILVYMVFISENCTGLKELFVSGTVITDASLIAIAKNCTGLQLLNTDMDYNH